MFSKSYLAISIALFLYVPLCAEGSVHTLLTEPVILTGPKTLDIPPLSRTKTRVELDVMFSTDTIVKYTLGNGEIVFGNGRGTLKIEFNTKDGKTYRTKKGFVGFYDTGILPSFEEQPPKSIKFTRMLIIGENLPRIEQIRWIDTDTPEHIPPKQGIVVGRILSATGCDKYCWYNVAILRSKRGPLHLEHGTNMQMSRLSKLPQPEIGKTYSLTLELYNPSAPHLGYKIVSFSPD